MVFYDNQFVKLNHKVKIIRSVTCGPQFLSGTTTNFTLAPLGQKEKVKISIDKEKRNKKIHDHKYMFK